ncbi:alpha/beta hydrolase [Sphingopyxis sp. QXT-31]|nr:alpha/beta hydrolase [Sphingopyxis sp. QXT-31]
MGGTSSAAAAPKGKADHVTAADGTRLFVRDWGSGKPVLFLAGWTLPSDFWGYQMAAIAEAGMRAVAYDRRGHGRSSDPGRNYGHDTLADDLARVIAALGLEDVTLVAHSMGGTEVARYFARHGGGVAKVVLVGTITPFLMKAADNPYGIDPAMLAALRAPLATDFPGWIAANARPFFVPETSAAMIEWGKELMLQTSLLAAMAMARANAETDFRADMRRIAVPTLLVHGDKDASAPLPLTAEATAALIPHTQLEIFEDAPHGLPLTHVARLNKTLLEFVAKA